MNSKSAHEFLRKLAYDLYDKCDPETVIRLKNILLSIDPMVFCKKNSLNFSKTDIKMGNRIALSGKMCSGKTTSSDAFIKKNPTYTRHSIAGRLKEIAIHVFGMDPDKKDRDLLQKLGTDLRIIDENVWLNSFFKGLDGDVICDDLRYYNELVSLNNNGFKTIRLYVDPEVQYQRIKELYPDFKQEQLLHKSETDLDNVTEFEQTMTSEQFVANLL
jgi:hypothetical protein